MVDKKIFIACPISKHFEKGRVEEDYKTFIKYLYNNLKNIYKNVFLALEREEYGNKRMEGNECTPLDFEEMQNTDLLIAIPEDSMGVAVEIGWASALKKDIILILDEKYKVSPLVEYIDTVTNCKKIKINTTNNYDENLKVIENFIENL